MVIYPATTQAPRPTFGAMKGSGEILEDLIAPVATAIYYGLKLATVDANLTGNSALQTLS